MALQVECEHRTKRVRVTPMMTMYQVLEAAQQEFQVEKGSTRQFQLLHRKRAIDLSLPFRLTGISTNATLEMTRVAASAETSKVRVCVQVPDGRRRVQTTIRADATLESMLSELKLLPSTAPFALPYLQQEIAFESFATTKLRDLGISSGSVLFRLVAEAMEETIMTTPSTAAPMRVEDDAPRLQQTDVDELIEEKPAVPVEEDVPAMPMEEEEKADVFQDKPHVKFASTGDIFSVAQEDRAMVDEPVQHAAMSSFDALQLLRDSCFDAVSKPAILTLMKIVTNILSYPENEKMRSIRISNGAFHRNVGQYRGGIEFLISVGFVCDSENQVLTMPSATDCLGRLETGLCLLSNEADELRINDSERPKVIVKVPNGAEFDAFKPQITRVAAQPRGLSATETQVDTLRAKQEALLATTPIPPRNTKVLWPNNANSEGNEGTVSLQHQTQEELPRGDSSMLIASMKARHAELEKAQNFRTQAMRELDELKRKKVFQSTLVRVQFPDRVSIQAAFHPTETIAAVMEHLQAQLAPSAADCKFYLFVSPPFQKLAPEKTLTELALVPAAHVYLSWINEPPNVRNQACGGYLLSELHDEETKAEEVPSPAEYPRSIPLAETQATSRRDAGSVPAASRTESRRNAKPKAGSKPGWLKL